MTPNPASVQLRLAANSATASITSAGGSVQATATDGTRFTLAVPADALIHPASVTLTPVDALEGLPAGSAATAVRLAPEGLLLWKPATLTIQPPPGVAIDSAVALSGQGDGSEIHQVALDAANGAVTLSLSHFSVEIVIPGPPIEPGGWPDAIVPTDPWAQVADILGELLRRIHDEPERADEITQQMEDVLATFFDQIIEPQLAGAESSCNFAEAFYPKALQWARTTETLDMEALVARALRIKQSMIKALNNCLDELGVRCLDASDKELHEKVLGLVRQLQIAGFERPLPAPCASCGKLGNVAAWAGAISYSLDAAGEGSPYPNHHQRATLAHSGQLVLMLNQRDPNRQTEATSVWEGTVEGTTSVSDTVTRTGPSGTVSGDAIETITDTMVASGPPSVSTFELRLEKTTCAYSLSLFGFAPAAVRYTKVFDDAGKIRRFEETGNNGIDVRLFNQPVPETAGTIVLEGDARLTPGQFTPPLSTGRETTLYFQSVNPIGAHWIIQRWNPSALIASLQWTIQPADLSTP